MSDLFGDVSKGSPRSKELNGYHILYYVIITYFLNLIFLKTFLSELSIEVKKTLFIFSPVSIWIELCGFTIHTIFYLLDFVF